MPIAYRLDAATVSALAASILASTNDFTAQTQGSKLARFADLPLAEKALVLQVASDTCKAMDLHKKTQCMVDDVHRKALEGTHHEPGEDL